MPLAVEDEADAVVLLTLSIVSVWMAWMYWPGAHEVLARLCS